MFSTLIRLLIWGGLLYIILPLDHQGIEDKAAETTEMLTDEARRLCAANPAKCFNGVTQAGEAMGSIGKTLSNQ